MQGDPLGHRNHHAGDARVLCQCEVIRWGIGIITRVLCRGEVIRWGIGIITLEV